MSTINDFSVDKKNVGEFKEKLAVANESTQYFIATREAIGSGISYKAELRAKSYDDAQAFDAKFLKTANKISQEIKTISIEGPFQKSSEDHLLIFCNDTAQVFLEQVPQLFEDTKTSFVEQGLFIKEDVICNVPDEIENGVLRAAKKLEVDVTNICDNLSCKVLAQAASLNEKMLKDRKSFPKIETINEILTEVVSIAKVIEEEILASMKITSELLKQGAESAQKQLATYEKEWWFKEFRGGSESLKEVLLLRQLKKRQIMAKVVTESQLATGKLNAVAEHAIANIYSQIEDIVKSKSLQ